MSCASMQGLNADLAGETRTMRVTMVGAGYVGLVSGACLAELGHEVICVDRDAQRLAMLRAGRMPIYEPGLDRLVAANVARGRLGFSGDLGDAVAGAEVIFIAVGTPAHPRDGHADLKYVHAAAAEIGAALTGHAVIANKSTVPVGTGDEVERIIRAHNPGASFDVVSNPEFLREGSAIGDFMRPDRAVIGAESMRARKAMDRLYAPLAETGVPLMHCERRTAEITKYAANAFLAMKISFINEVADFCEKVGADVEGVAAGIGLDRRIGAAFLNAGPGYGGSCFPKDTMALVKSAEEAGARLRLVETTIAANESRKRDMGRRIIRACGGSVRGKTICLLGLTFKANTDDMRAAPALTIARSLVEQGAIVRAYDPAGMEQAAGMLEGVVLEKSPYQAARQADAVAIVTEWDEFRRLDLKRLAALVRGKVLVDLRNVCSEEEATAAGFMHIPIGRAATPGTMSEAVLINAEPACLGMRRAS